MQVSAAFGPLVVVLCAAMRLAAVPEVSQQARTLGPSRCVRCHDAERAWWESGEGRQGRGHVRALVRLEGEKAARLARTLGVKDPYAPAAGCVGCHATVVEGDAIEGVSCESCHGPGGAYLDIHAQPGAYRVAVAAGMADVVGRPEVWALGCLTCHVVRDRRLVAAGHPSGAAFKVARQVEGVARHWKNSYSAETIEAAGLAARARQSASAER